MPAVPRTWQALLKEASPLSLGVDWAQNDCVPALLLPVRAEQLLATVLQDIIMMWPVRRISAAHRVCSAGELMMMCRQVTCLQGGTAAEFQQEGCSLVEGV